MNKLFNKWLSERTLFYFVLLVNLILVTQIKFYPSMDGPAHLYNSTIINHLLTSDSPLLNSFFKLNQFPIPNWIGHFILVFFNSFLPAFLAEKALLFFYLIGLSLSFRLLLKQLNPKGNIISIFVFPFAYSFLFQMGFYNYSISFIFLFFTLYYWLKTRDVKGIKKHFVLFLLLFLCYFSSIPAFVFTGFCLVLFLFAAGFIDYLKTKNLSAVLKKSMNEAIVLLLLALPSIILFILFYRAVVFVPIDHEYSVDELLTWLIDVRPLIVYNYTEEQFFTTTISYLMLSILVLSLFYRIRKRAVGEWYQNFNKADIILIPAVLSLVLLFITPDGSTAEMMSDRYALLFYMFCLIWVAAQQLPALARIIATVIVLCVHFNLLLMHLSVTQKMLNNDAESLNMAGQQIEPNSIVLPVSLTDNWLQVHFSNYAGIDKPLVILENYEADVRWFPIQWNTEQMPKVKLGTKDSLAGFNWQSNFNSNTVRQIDYVLLFGDISKLNDANLAEFKTELSTSYTLTYKSGNNYVTLYRRNNFASLFKELH